MSKLGKRMHYLKLKQCLLSKEDLKTLETLKQASSNEDIRVTCMGLYNHGKSCLLNALIKDAEGATFKSADVRETTQNKAIKHKRYTFVDTPGLNAQKHDDERVMDAVKASDINIFVHNVNTGEFVASEMRFFYQVQKYWKDPKVFIERTLFVLSRIDEANSKTDIEATAQRMTQQLEEVFGVVPTMIPVSALDYLDGLSENEQELMDESNFAVLESQLDSLYSKIQPHILKDKKARYMRYAQKIIQKLDTKMQNKKLKMAQLQTERTKHNDNLASDILRFKQTLNEKFRMLEGV